MAKLKDPFAEFKGKQKLNEQEVNLLKRRLNDGKIKISQIRSGGYALTQDQVAKGKKWLMNLWLTKSGAERKNNPFGYREQAVLESFQTIRLHDFYDIGFFRGPKYYVPIYKVVGRRGTFEYYVRNGEVNVVG